MHRRMMALLCHHTAQVGHYERTHWEDRFIPKGRRELRWRGSWL